MASSSTSRSLTPDADRADGPAALETFEGTVAAVAQGLHVLGAAAPLIRANIGDP